MMMGALELLDAELVGFDPLDLVRALPGVLKGTGQVVRANEDKKAAQQAQKVQQAPQAAQKPVPAPAPAPAAALGLPWKIGGAAAALGLVFYVLKR